MNWRYEGQGLEWFFRVVFGWPGSAWLPWWAGLCGGCGSG